MPRAAASRASRIAEFVAAGELCDVVLVGRGGERVQGVRALLAAASPVVREVLLLKAAEGVESELHLELTENELKLAIAYACGAVPKAWRSPILQRSSIEVRRVAEALQIHDLDVWWLQQRGVSEALESDARRKRQHVPKLEGSSFRQSALRLVLVIWVTLVSVGSFLAWWPAFSYTMLENSKFMDDAMIKKNPNVYEELNWGRLLRTDFWGLEMFQAGVWTHKSFRPLTVLSFRLNFWLHTFDSSGWHITNLCIHACCACLLGIFGSVASGLPKIWASLLTALFLAHPVHTESVLYIVGRADPLCLAVVLVSALIYAPCLEQRTISVGALLSIVGRLLLSVVLIVAAGLCKETGFCFFGLLAGCEILRSMCAARPQTKWRKFLLVFRLTALLLLGIAACYGRMWYTGGTEIETMDPHSNPVAVHGDRWVRVLSYSLVHGIYAKLLLWPTFLCYDYSFDAIPLVHTLHDCRLLLPLAAYAGAAQLLCCSLWPLRPRWTTLRFGVSLHPIGGSGREGPIIGFAIIILSFVPMSNVLFPVGTMIGERLLYIPSAGLLVSLVALSRIAVDYGGFRLGVFTLFLLMSLSVFWIWLTAVRVPEWASAESITVADGLKQLRSTRVQFNYANVHLLHKRYDEALATYEIAIGLDPTDRDSLPLYHAGQILFYKQRYEEAEHHLEKAVNGFYSPLTIKEEEIFHDYALTLWFRENANGAIQNFQKSLTFNPYFTKSLNNLGCAAGIGALTGRLPQEYLRYGIQMLEQAVQVDPGGVLYWRNAIALLLLSGDQPTAELAWQRLAALDPTAVAGGAPRECTWEFYFR